LNTKDLLGLGTAKVFGSLERDLAAIETGMESMEATFETLAVQLREFPDEIRQIAFALKNTMENAGMTDAEIARIMDPLITAERELAEEQKVTLENEEYRVKVSEEVKKSMQTLIPLKDRYVLALKNVDEATQKLNEDIDITLSRLEDLNKVLGFAFDPLSNLIDSYDDLNGILKSIDELKFENLDLMRQQGNLSIWRPDYMKMQKELEDQINDNDKSINNLENARVDAAIGIAKAEADATVIDLGEEDVTVSVTVKWSLL
jgi:chromosome segregation ATPase